MSREYPRFLFSNPHNTKSKGPFIIHTLDPMFIVKVTRTPLYAENLQTITDGTINFTFFEHHTPSKKLSEITDAMYKWLYAQIKMGEIVIEKSTV